jgi:hypothetical protein
MRFFTSGFFLYLRYYPVRSHFEKGLLFAKIFCIRFQAVDLSAYSDIENLVDYGAFSNLTELCNFAHNVHLFRIKSPRNVLKPSFAL